MIESTAVYECSDTSVASVYVEPAVVLLHVTLTGPVQLPVKSKDILKLAPSTTAGV